MNAVLKIGTVFLLTGQVAICLVYFIWFLSGWTIPAWQVSRERFTRFYDFPMARLADNVSDPFADRPSCTHAILRTYFQHFRGFPWEGEWRGDGCIQKVIPDPNGPITHITARSKLLNDTYPCPDDSVRNLTFHPEICTFPYVHLPKRYLFNCFARNRVKKIVTLGDSNGRRYHDVFVGLLNASAGVSCITVRAENASYQMDLDYFKLADMKSKVTLARRGCHSCGSVLHECVLAAGDGRAESRVLIEHIPLLHFRDASVKLIDHINQISNRTIYFPEFIFRYYLSINPPDVVIVAAPFNHEKYHKSLYRATLDIKYFFDILGRYLRGITKVFVIPGFHEQEELKDDKVYPPKGYKYGGFTANELIDRMNVALYQVLETYFMDEDKGYYGFLDLGRISADVSREWACDAMHMFHVWYERTTSQFVQLFCQL